MNNEKTIKQLADELGVSKQTIQKIIEKLSLELKPKKIGNKYRLTAENEQYIKNILGFKTDTESNISDKESNKTNNFDNRTNKTNTETDKSNKLDMSEYLDLLFKQLDTKDQQIEKLQKLLDQQQILTLQANKKIEELELKSNESENQKKENEFSFSEEREENRERKKEESSVEKNVSGTTDKKNFWTRWFKK